MKLLLRQAKDHSWRSELWTADRVAAMIERQFGIAYRSHQARSWTSRSKLRACSSSFSQWSRSASWV